MSKPTSSASFTLHPDPQAVLDQLAQRASGIRFFIQGLTPAEQAHLQEAVNRSSLYGEKGPLPASTPLAQTASPPLCPRLQELNDRA